MTAEELKTAKNFRNQMLVCALLCWACTILTIVIKPEFIHEVIIVPIGAVILTNIYLNMKRKIKKHESLK